MAEFKIKSRLTRLATILILLASGVLAFLWLISSNTGILERKQWVVYLGNPLENPEIWRVSMDGGNREQLTRTGGKVVDFSISSDGHTIAYSVLNQAGGSDLWLVSTSGRRSRLLVNCGLDVCSQPAWSPRGRIIAYSRQQKSGIDTDTDKTERIWTINVKSRKTGALFNETNITGISAVFSPDGNHLAFYDTSRHAIQFFDLRSGKSEFLPTQVEAVGAFSPDSTRMIFTDVDVEKLPPVQLLYIVNTSQKNVAPFLSGDSTIIDVSDPVWSSMGGWIVFTAQSSQVSGRQLWIVHADGSGLRAITNDAAAVHASASWSPDGTNLIFQRLELGSSDNRPEIVIWNLSNDRFTVLAQDAALPAWVP